MWKNNFTSAIMETRSRRSSRVREPPGKYTSEICDSLKIKISKTKESASKKSLNAKTRVIDKDDKSSSTPGSVKARRRSRLTASEDEDSGEEFTISTPNKKKPKSPKKVSKVKKEATKVVKSKANNTSRDINKLSKVNKLKTKMEKIFTKEEAIREALIRLHSSSVPESLPCRESQFNDVYNFVEQKLLEGEGGCMYISGVPGTGKTATLYEVKRKLEADPDLPRFKFIEINALKLGEPSKFTAHFLLELTGEKMSNYQATDVLNDRFKNGQTDKDFIILLVDELDYLRTKKQDVLYHIFDWPNTKNSKLIVLAIANAMDLPERLLLNRVASRLGLTRLSFQPYNFKELEQIVRSRLESLQFNRLFDGDALQLICRKVSAVSGDARRALDICRKAVEIAIATYKTEITMVEVDKALQEIFNSIKITRIRYASLQEQMFLRCLIQNFRMSGLEEAQFIDVYNSHVELCRFEGQIVPTTAELSKVATNLDLSKLILFEKSPSHLYRRIRLNISVNDINFALNLED